MLLVSVHVRCVHTCVHVHGGQRRRPALLSYPSVFASHWTWNCTSGQQAPEILMSVFHSARVVGIWPHPALGFEPRLTCLHGKITLSYLCSSHLNFWDRVSSLNLELAISAWLTGKGTSRFCLFLNLPFHWGYICGPSCQTFISMLVIPTESFLLV